ncbi:MAG TPA: hypothetical protein VGQ47_04465, partial [Candidatus Limnocylindrales bacterium]|nr:hypothetical protein [Candidatus Limnocylindrales bacterium]
MSVGLQRLRDEPERLRRGAVDKNEDPGAIDEALRLDERRRTLTGEADTLKAERNALSKEIGERVRAGADPNGSEVARLRARSGEIGARIERLDEELAGIEAALDELLLRIPAPPDPDVPVGGEEAHVVVRT